MSVVAYENLIMMHLVFYEASWIKMTTLIISFRGHKSLDAFLYNNFSLIAKFNKTYFLLWILIFNFGYIDILCWFVRA